MEKQFQQRWKEVLDMQTNPPEFLRRLDSLKVRELSELLAGLSYTGYLYTPVEPQALRDAVQAVIYRKLTESLVENITKLDTSTARLARIGMVLTFVVGVAGILVTIAVALR